MVCIKTASISNLRGLWMLSALESCFGQRTQSCLWCFLRLPWQYVCQAWGGRLRCSLYVVYYSKWHKLSWPKPELFFNIIQNELLVSVFCIFNSFLYFMIQNSNLIGIWINMKKIIFKMGFGNIYFHGTIDRNHLSTYPNNYHSLVGESI